jgi:hypothetical protein
MADHGLASRNPPTKGAAMSINLSDLPAAVADYVENNVTVEVSEVKHGISSVLQPHEKGRFNVTVTNNGAVRLTDLVYELSVSPGSVAKLISPEGVVFALDGMGGRQIPVGVEVERLSLTGVEAVTWTSVDGGASVTSPDFQVKAQATLGNAIIRCTLHATVDQACLFRAEQKGSTTRHLSVS